MELNISPDQPFQLRTGDSQDMAVYNRLCAINRINYLVSKEIPGFDLREKGGDYRINLDLKMYHDFYRQDPNKKIDEEFCQRAAQICLDIEGYKGLLEEPVSKSVEIKVTPIVKKWWEFWK